MRRKDKMQDSHKVIEIMQNAAYCVLSASPANICDFKPYQKAVENSELSNEYIKSLSIPDNASFIDFYGNGAWNRDRIRRSCFSILVVKLFYMESSLALCRG